MRKKIGVDQDDHDLSSKIIKKSCYSLKLEKMVKMEESFARLNLIFQDLKKIQKIARNYTSNGS